MVGFWIPWTFVITDLVFSLQCSYEQVSLFLSFLLKCVCFWFFVFFYIYIYIYYFFFWGGGGGVIIMLWRCELLWLFLVLALLGPGIGFWCETWCYIFFLGFLSCFSSKFVQFVTDLSVWSFSLDSFMVSVFELCLGITCYCSVLSLSLVFRCLMQIYGICCV